MRNAWIASLGAAAALSACAGIPKETIVSNTASRADEHRISVAEAGARLDVPVSAGDMTLSPAMLAELDRFAGAYARAGHGPLILSVPANGANADAAARLAHEARMRLAEHGVPYVSIAGSTYDATGAADAPIVLTYTRFEATAPDCLSIARQDLAHQSNNQAYDSFGCSNQANLAALIEDPHDLLAPREETTRDGARRATMMGRYRAGQPTHATRSPDERVSISTVAR